MVHKNTKYLLLRGNTFHFRWRVPAELRSTFCSTEFRRSLRTTDHLQAKARAGRFVMAVGVIQSVQRAFTMGEVTFDDYILISIKHWKAMSDSFKIGLITVGDISVDCNGDYEKEQEIAKALLQAKSDSDIALQRVINERPVPAERQAVLKMPDSGMLFSELFSKFMAHKTDPVERRKEGRKPLSSKIQMDYKSYFNRLLPIMGDLPIALITRKILRDVILTCRCLPKGNIKAYKNIPFTELLELELPDSVLLSDTTVGEFKKMVQGMFRYAVDSELVESSPAIDMNLKLNKASSYAPYSKAEVRLILESAQTENKVWKKWLPAIAAYTGCRRSEIVQLRGEDVKFDDDSGRHYFSITPDAGPVKSKAARRGIPIHKKLVELGFLEFVETTGDSRIFKDLQPEGVTAWFTKFLGKLEIERFDSMENRKVFHSFRHTVISNSRGAGNPVENVQQVCGHEKVSAGVTDIYTHDQPLKVVLPVIDLIDYSA